MLEKIEIHTDAVFTEAQINEKPETFLAATFGPKYPQLGATVAKYRLKARHGTLKASERKAYGLAVLEDILALQRSELTKGLGLLAANPIPNCASGTRENDGKAILEAVARQIANSLHTGNKPLYGNNQIGAYEAAMKAKREAMDHAIKRLPADMEILAVNMWALVAQTMNQTEAAHV